MLLICHFGGKAKRPRSTAIDSSDSDEEENAANGGAIMNMQRRHSMSASLMSCVRENSPPLDVVDGANCCSATGPMSLPDCHMVTMSTTNQQQFTSTPLSVTNINESSSSGGGAGGGGGGTATNTEPKRRRFHPLRNLRRIFRRRTITTVADTPPSANTSNTLPPPTSSTSEKNLRSATLSSISSVVSASSPSSPLTHQQLQEAFSSQSLPKSKSYSIGGSGGVGVDTANSGSATKSPHRDALLASVLGVKHKHLHTKQQLAQQLQQQLEEAVHEGEMYTTTSSMYHHHQHQQVGSSGGVLFQPPHSVRQSLGVAVLPSAMNRSFYAERQKLRSVGDSSQELDSSGNDSGSATGTTSINNTMNGSGNGSANGGRTNGCASNEMTDSQRSLSEGRLVDSDYSHDPLSQSHDSVFSESASASLFSNRDYQAELSDVLRKRNRNRQDASEEDLGLPRSPASPQRRAEHTHRSQLHATGNGQQNNSNHNNIATSSSATGNQSEVSSLSLLSMNSGDGDEILAASTANNSTISTKDIVQERSQTSTSVSGRSITRSSTVSTTSVSSEIYRHSSSGSLGSDSNRDEPDLLDAKCQRLSHSAAKHKMALRPAKKKGPSRQHRRTLETSIPEANEDSLRLGSNALLDISEHDIKAKTRSLPPSVNTKILDKHAVDMKNVTSPSKSKTKSSVSTNEQMINVKRSKIEKMEKNSGGAKSSLSTSISTSSTAIAAATNLFGLRTLTAKATALFEPPQESSTDPTPSEQDLKIEKDKENVKEKLKEKDTTNNVITDITESGFLRRLIQRNSKRSISRPNPASGTNAVVNAIATDEDKIDRNQSECDSKSKIQISTSCLDMKSTPESSLTKLDKSRSALSYEQNIEETRKDIKREIMSVGNTGLNAMLNTQNLVVSTNNSANSIKESATSPPKPKSGAAARQRYIPQDIGSLDRKENVQHSSSNATTSESYTSSTSSILSKCSQLEVFQSTSIIREITASQASSVNSMSSLQKSEHHFEKKPKIVGLSAFQQKISRSNDSVGRLAHHGNSNSNSTNSLDAAGDVLTFKSQEQKQRKLVEKSRSFRTYQEDSSYSTTTTVHNNMPSLPDLTLNLRVPCYNDFPLNGKNTTVTTPDRSTSLGFEVNELAAIRGSTPRTESTGNLTASNYNFSKNIAVKCSPTKLVSLSQTSASSEEPDETNIDLVPKSSFINVLRKPTSTTSLEEKPAIVTVCSNSNRKSIDKNIASKSSSISLVAVVPPSSATSKVEQHQLRPKVLQLRDSNTSIDTSTSTDDLKLTPTTASVPLREKSKLKSNVAGANVRNSMETLTTSTKYVERKSAPAPVLQANKGQSFKTTRRSTSLMDSPPNSQNGIEDRNAVGKIVEPTSGSSTPNGDSVPEFMRIQLNRVDPARMAKSANVVLAKNVRETHYPQQQQQQQQQVTPQQQQHITKEANERDSNLEDICLRRLSNESVEIIEKSSPTEVDKQKTVFDITQNSSNTNGNNSNNNNKSPTKANILVSALPPRSPIKKQPSVVAITPTTPTDGEDNILLRSKPMETPIDATTMASNKLSLQERKRLFLNEEKLKTDKRIEELRNERKKSITEEVYRKSFAKSEEKLETSEKAASESVVMLRKKSFCATTQASATTNGNRDDPTPELMKVFARRSLKIKDEDINALTDKLHASSGSINNTKKFVSTQQNVDSDKENQSASEEKLDKLPKSEAPLETQTHMGGKVTNSINNRNSLADFRIKSVVGSGTALSNGLSLNNSSNHNNNNYNNNNNNTAANSNNSTTGVHTVNNTTTNGISGSGVNRASFLPPIKVAGFRPIPIERNNSVSKIYPTTACETLNNNTNNNSNSNNVNNNNNNHHTNQSHYHHHQLNGKSNERQSLNVNMLESGTSSSNTSNSSSSGNYSNNKTIERSATVSEFKGIHQRRAEWEQRAKEALK